MTLKSVIFSLVLILASGAGLAQQPPQPQPGHPLSDPIGENLFPPELIMQHQKAIGLDDAQKTYIRGEISKAQGRFTDLQWQLQDAMESLAGLVSQTAPDEQQVMTQLDKVLNLEREIKRAQLGLMVRLKCKLTADQQAHLRQLRDKPPAD